MDKYYKDSQGQIYQYSPIQTPKEGLIALTEVEVQELLNPTIPLSVQKEHKCYEIGAAFNEHVRGSFVCSYGYPMQFKESDLLKMEGAIQLLNASGEETGYITDAEDVSHWDITAEMMETIKLEMLMEYGKAHKKKQLLRIEIAEAVTDAELEAITWNSV